MNPLRRSAVGVDVSDGTLKAVQLGRRGRRVVLGRTWRIPFHESDDPRQGALAALRSLQRGAHLGSLPRIVLSVPDRGHFSRTYLIPSMEAHRLGDMVRYEALNELGLPPEDLVLRWHLRKGVVEQQVHTVALRRARLDAFVAALREAHVPFDELETPGFALGSFVEHEHPAGRDRVLLGVGQLATHLVLLGEDGIWTRHLALGLADGAPVAELARRLALEIDGAVATLLPADRSFRPADVVLSEEGALSAPLTSALERELELPVTRFSELERIDTRGARGAGAAQVLCMGQAFGLALAGLGLGRFRCPVLEGNARREAGRRLPLALASLTLSAAGLLLLTGLLRARADTLSEALPSRLVDELHEVDQRADALRGEISQARSADDALLALARRRPAVFALRRALAAFGTVAEDRGDDPLVVESAGLVPREPGRPGLLTLTLRAPTSRDPTLRVPLEAAFGAAFDQTEVRGPQATPGPGGSRWVVEVGLP